MIIYEVNLIIEPTILMDYRQWLSQHIQDILALPGFINADLYQDKDIPCKLTVCYRLQDEASVNNYLDNHAEHMRAQAQILFANQFSATRRIFKKIDHYESN